MLRFPTASRVRLTGATALAAALLLGGCAGGTTTESKDKGSTTSGSITWWGWTPDEGPAKEYIAAFNKEYPDIKVTFKRLTIDGYNAAVRPALASSVGPDVYAVAPGSGNGPVQDYGTFAVDLTPAVEKKLGPDWRTKLAPIGVDGLTVKGSLAALSVGSVYSGPIWINKDLFDKYGLKPPTTYDEWKQVCATFKSHGVGCFVQGAAQVAFNEDTIQTITNDVKPGAWQDAVNGKIPWTDPSIVKALTIWKNMFTDGIMQPGALGTMQYPDANNKFMSGKYAMVMMGTWYTQYATQAGATAGISGAGVAHPKPFPEVPIAFPDVAGTGNTASLFGDADFGLAVNKRSKHIAAATTFVTWLGTSQAGQQLVANLLNDVPALNSAKPAWNQIQLVNATAQQGPLQTMLDSAAKATDPRFANVSADLQTAIGEASTTVAAGKASPEQAAATLQAAAEKISKSGKN
jgi:raffinose/stachyose/melibiose transport system substrate-binding protein